MSDFDERDAPGLRALGFGILLCVGLVAAFLIRNEVDRAGRTETVDSVQPNGALHLVCNAIVLTESGGRVISYDVGSRESTTLLDGLLEPVAADVGPDGTACAVSQGTRAARSAWMTCTNGVRVDLSTFDVPLVDGSAGAPMPLLSDIVSDGDTGWIIADAGRMAILHVDREGRMEIVTRFRPIAGFDYAPRGLSRKDDQLTVAVGRAGITTVAVADRDQITKGGSYVAGEESVAVESVGGSSPLVLVHSPSSSSDLVTYTGHGPDAPSPHVVDHLDRATGIVRVGGDRLALAVNRQLILVRPTDLP